MSDEATGKIHKLEASAGMFSVTGFAVDMHVITYPQKLLAFAEQLIGLGEHSISIVVAHMACEVATDRALSDAFKAKGLEYLEDPIEDLLPGNNLGNSR